MIFEGSGVILGAVLEPKSIKKRRKTRSKTRAILRPMSGSVRRSLVRVVGVGTGPWAAVYVAPGQYSKNNRTRNRSSKTTKNEIQEMIDQKSNEQRRNEDEKRDDVWDLTRHGPDAWGFSEDD